MRTATLILTFLLLYSCGKDPYAKGNLTEYDSNGNLVSQGDTTQWKTTNDSNVANQLFSTDTCCSLRNFYSPVGFLSNIHGFKLKQRFCENGDYSYAFYPNPYYVGSTVTIHAKAPAGKKIWFITTGVKSENRNLGIIYAGKRQDSSDFLVSNIDPSNAFVHGSDMVIYDIVTTDSCSHVGYGYVKVLHR